MRTTVTLDQDVYEIAALYARGRGVTLGKAISELARKGVEARQPEDISAGLMRAPNGLMIFAPRGDGRVITNEMVKAALEEDDY
jgi:hypothetical protein